MTRGRPDSRVTYWAWITVGSLLIAVGVCLFVVVGVGLFTGRPAVSGLGLCASAAFLCGMVLVSATDAKAKS